MNHIVAGPHLHTEAMGPEEPPTAALFRAFSHAGVDELPSEIVLYDFVDPDALDRLFGDRSTGTDFIAVTFEAWDLIVTVTSGHVSLHETASVTVTEAHSPTLADQSTQAPPTERERL